MLEKEYATLYASASAVAGWKDANKNDLINACIDHEDDEYLAEPYLSAVILRYWGSVWKYYRSSKNSGFTPEDCYAWLVEAIMYALEKRRWRDPDNPLSRDPNAPDKVINRCIYSHRLYYYVQSNADKRRSNFATVSIDAEDDNGPAVVLKDGGDGERLYGDIKQISSKLYAQNRWMQSFLLSFLAAEDEVYSYDSMAGTWKINLGRTVGAIKSLDFDQFSSMLSRVSPDSSDFKSHFREIQRMSDTKLRSAVSYALENLKADKDLEELTC